MKNDRVARKAQMFTAHIKSLRERRDVAREVAEAATNEFDRDRWTLEADRFERLAQSWERQFRDADLKEITK